MTVYVVKQTAPTLILLQYATFPLNMKNRKPDKYAQDLKDNHLSHDVLMKFN